MLNYSTLSQATILETIESFTAEDAAETIWLAVEEALREARSEAAFDAIREYEERM